MEKLVNKLKKSMNKLNIAFLLLIVFLATTASAQEPQQNDTVAKDSIIPISVNTFKKENSYELGGISVSGLKKFEDEISNLQVLLTIKHLDINLKNILNIILVKNNTL